MVGHCDKCLGLKEGGVRVKNDQCIDTIVIDTVHNGKELSGPKGQTDRQTSRLAQT